MPLEHVFDERDRKRGWLAGLKEKVLTEVWLRNSVCQTELKNYNSTVSLNHQTWGLNNKLAMEFGDKILINLQRFLLN